MINIQCNRSLCGQDKRRQGKGREGKGREMGEVSKARMVVVVLVVCVQLLFLLPQTSYCSSFNIYPAPSLSPADRMSLESLSLKGYLSFDNTSAASKDWGLIRHLAPAGVVYPSCVNDIVAIVAAVAQSESDLTIAARGLGHSIGGQSQAHNGIIIEMRTLRGIKVMPLGAGGGGANPVSVPYVEATGGELWVDVLAACLEYGLAPRSWTDYLYLTVGGTLSNAGISGQSFRHGPEVSNVLQLEVVTGKGEVVECSPTRNPELFFAVLGGLGQFGIITKARILLERAPQRVRWIRAMYSDFTTFKNDQELLISATDESQTFDYVEGFVVVNDGNVLNGWGSVPFAPGQISAAMIPPQAGTVLYYLEVTKTYTAADLHTLDQRVESILAPLSFHRSLMFSTDVTYSRFLDRIHDVEMHLKSKGLWDIPHPWLNIFLPASSVERFDALVFKELVSKDFSGPMLVYPMNRSKWDHRLSVAVPDEEIFYIVAFLRNKLPSGGPSLAALMEDNANIMRICEPLGCKQYLPRYEDRVQWKRHFGSKWDTFVHNKQLFDPLALLAPGQNIFLRRRNYITNHYA